MKKIITTLVYLYIGIITLNAQTWSVEPSNYEFSMNIISKVYVNGDTINEQNAQLGAFVGAECRGVAKSIVNNGNYKLFLLTIYSNVTNGETIKFQLADKSGSKYIIENKIIFNSDAIYGSVDSPVLFMDKTMKYVSTNFISFYLDNQLLESEIDTINKTIVITLDKKTDLTSLKSTFFLYPGAKAYVNKVEQESGVTTNNFTNSVVYTIVGGDSKTINWTISIKLIDDIVDKHKIVRVYPNPTNNFITVENKQTVRSVKLVTISGQQLLEKEVNSNIDGSITLNMLELNNGVYILYIEMDNGDICTRKVIKY